MESQQAEFNIAKDRKQFLINLQKSVDNAYINRKKEHFLLFSDQSVEDLQQADEVRKKILSADDNTIIEFKAGQSEPSFVSVSNPHDYPILLEMALKKISGYTEKGFDGFLHRLLGTAEYIQQKVKTSIKHEAEHFVSGIGYKGFDIKYGVDFVQDRITRIIAVTPQIRLVGKVPYGVYRQMVAGAVEPSASDQILLTKDNQNHLPILIRFGLAISKLYSSKLPTAGNKGKIQE